MNKIYNEDCLETMKRMDDSSIDLVVTSPPYDNLRDYNGYSFDFDGIAKELFRVIKQGGVVVWVVGDATVKGSESGTSFKQALYFKEIGFNLHDTMIYAKDGSPFPGQTRYNQIFEYMFVFSKGKLKTFNPIKDRKNLTNKNGVSTYRGKDGKTTAKKIKTKVNELSTRNNIWKIGGGFMKSTKYKLAFEHPAIFPERLAIDHILSWSNKGDIVYDPFMGSGTTAVAAIKHERQWVGSEMSKEYCDISNERIKQELSQIRLPLDDIQSHESVFDVF